MYIYITCSNINKNTYIQTQHSEIKLFCRPCLKEKTSFNTLTDKEMEKLYNGKHMLYCTPKTHQVL